ncbi:MAG: hypothetical protein ACLQDY_14025 [Streptosporangiaceae bacterium]
MASAQVAASDLVAVFINLENLALGAGENLPGPADLVPFATGSWLIAPRAGRKS